VRPDKQLIYKATFFFMSLWLCMVSSFPKNLFSLQNKKDRADQIIEIYTVIVPANEFRLQEIIQALENSYNREAASILKTFRSAEGTSKSFATIIE